MLPWMQYWGDDDEGGRYQNFNILPATDFEKILRINIQKAL